MEKIAAVVTLYYPTDDDIKNINSYIDDVDKLYIIDNTPEFSNESRVPINKKIKYFFDSKNKGVAKALNIGVNMAIEDKYKWLLTMDQDSSFLPNSLKKMKKYISENDTKNIGIVSPWHSTKLEIKKPKEEVDYPIDVMTSGNLVNLDICKKIGGFKDWLFIDGIDIEYGLNLKVHNYKIARLNTVEIEHNLGNISYRNFLGRRWLITNHSAIRRYYMMRNYLYIRDLYEKEEKDFCKSLVNQKSNIASVLLFEKNKIKKLWNYYLGYRDYKKGKKGEK